MSSEMLLSDATAATVVKVKGLFWDFRDKELQLLLQVVHLKQGLSLWTNHSTAAAAAAVVEEQENRDC